MIMMIIAEEWLKWHILRGLPEWFVLAVVIATLIATPLVSIVSLLMLKSGGGKSWLGLYIQRRKLEEQFKIERLLSHSDSCRDFYTMSGFHEN
jgi:hypothetical protein